MVHVIAFSFNFLAILPREVDSLVRDLWVENGGCQARFLELYSAKGGRLDGTSLACRLNVSRLPCLVEGYTWTRFLSVSCRAVLFFACGST